MQTEIQSTGVARSRKLSLEPRPENGRELGGRAESLSERVPAKERHVYGFVCLQILGEISVQVRFSIEER